MAKTKPNRIYFLSYAFYSAPSEEGGFAPVNTTVLADIDGGKVISRLINDFSRWTEDKYEVTATHSSGRSEHLWQVEVLPTWAKEPLTCFVDFDFYKPERSNYQYDHYDLAVIFRTLVLNCRKADISPDWIKTADKTMNVVMGYHLL